jgi:hypothetical protein
VRADPATLSQLPPAIHNGYLLAYASALRTVAAPFALVALALAWLLPEVALREITRATGSAATHAMPSSRSSVDEIARALSVLASREGRRRFYGRIACRAGVDLDLVGGCFAFLVATDPPVQQSSLTGAHRP